MAVASVNIKFSVAANMSPTTQAALHNKHRSDCGAVKALSDQGKDTLSNITKQSHTLDRNKPICHHWQ